MIDTSGTPHHPAIEELVEVICNRTQNTDKGFYRAEVAYFLAKMASNMRAIVITKDRDETPVNLYAMLLATSGYGKGYSINIMESLVTRAFKNRFISDTMPVIADRNLWVIANDRAARKASDPQQEYDLIAKEYNIKSGPFAYTFDAGSDPAVKQLRHKLVLGGIGAVSLQIDEIGLRLINQTEVLTLYLELFDQGMVNQKITKVTNENSRNEEVDGKVPTNMLLFGAPTALFDGSKVEDQFNAMLDTGYARRCLFALGQASNLSFHSQTPAEIYDRLTAPQDKATIAKWSKHFHDLADEGMYNWKIHVERDVGIELIHYKSLCEQAAEKLPEHKSIQRAELAHRYNKALKLAGALAFVDQSNEVEMIHLMQAIKLVEESGEAFTRMMTREKPYIRLAKYIATCNEEVTESDLIDQLPYFKGVAAYRKDQLNLATGWGYKNNIIIKKTYGPNGIEIYKGEALQETDLGDMIFSYSEDFAYDYSSEEEPVAFDQLYVLTQTEGLHWCNHRFNDGHRCDEDTIPGFNMLVLDVDGGVSPDFVSRMLKEIKFLLYTTKRHTPEAPRFRLIIPISHVMHLDKEEYKEFVQDVITWLPFKATADVDESSRQRSKKWLTHLGEYRYNLDGELLDILPFIPKTAKNEEYHNSQKAIGSLDNLERWFASRIVNGNRNNMLLKYALALVDNGMTYEEIDRRVHALNKKLPDPTDRNDIDTSILVTVAKRMSNSDAAE